MIMALYFLFAFCTLLLVGAILSFIDKKYAAKTVLVAKIVEKEHPRTDMIQFVMGGRSAYCYLKLVLLNKYFIIPVNFETFVGSTVGGTINVQVELGALTNKLYNCKVIEQ